MVVYILVILAYILLFPIGAISEEMSMQNVRDKIVVKVNGEDEVWKLIWDGPTRNICGADDYEMSSTCPCVGFAYGETGDLNLVREKSGTILERMSLNKYFQNYQNDLANGYAILQKWKESPSDFENSNDEKFLKNVMSRPVVKILKLADYNHDGQATEFMLQIGAGPCGRQWFIVIGITKNDNVLHIFRDGKSLEPIVLGAFQWDALSRSQKKVTEVEDVSCGDHGADINETLLISVGNGEISVSKKVRKCNDKKRKKK